ncbi:hypothetical protein N7490_008096 [Penicillium lividum]|nr:hypothetical protein N7490_008096 [Penicillium lividum]
MSPGVSSGRSAQSRQSLPQKYHLTIPLLLFHDADTLLYIDPAPQDGLNKPNTTATIPLRVHSEKLLTTGSAQFAKLFIPRYQKRARKQRGFAEKLPDGIKYVLDLTPATHEEDAVIALTEVSCPMAIRTWASLQHRWNLPKACVGGEDEYQILEHPDPTSVFDPLVVNDLEESGARTHDEEEQGMTSNKPSQYDAEPALNMVFRKGLPVEYSAARHREGIEHVLHVLEGLSITLDTPCKLWTFFAVAKLFDLATLPDISAYITSWFYDTTNTRFIEIHPEIAYRVGCGIKSSELCWHAFQGLVSDEALLYLIRTANLTPLKMWRSAYTTSRVNENLDDTEVQRIEYASKSFMDTVFRHFIHLAGTQMSWLKDIPEYAKFIRHVHFYPEDGEKIRSIIETVKECARASIYRKLAFAGDPQRSCNAMRPRKESISFARTFESRDALVRLMSRKFWTDLSSVRIGHTYDSLTSPRHSHFGIHDSIGEIGCGLLAFQDQEDAKIRNIQKETLDERLTEFNEMAKRRAKELHETLAGQSEAQTASENKQWNLTINLRPKTPSASEPVASSSNEVSSTTTEMNQFLPMRAELAESPAEQARHFISQQPSQRPAFSLNDSQVHKTALDISQNPRFTLNISKMDLSDPGSPSNNPPEPSYREVCFDLELFIVSASAYVSQYSHTILHPYGQVPFQHAIGDLLTCLSDKEYQYLPLWAGGDDDETGGVFSDLEIPMIVTGGFSAPGPQVHTGSVASTDDSFSEINPGDFQSTIQGASHRATNSQTSEIVSVDSYDEVENPGLIENEVHMADTMRANCVSSVNSDEGNFDAKSVGGSTIVMGSPKLSGFSDDDMDMVENEDDEFDMVEDLN